MENTIKTGTTTIGVVCKDGVVLAADKRATSGNMIVDKKINKILPVSDEMAVTTAGVVSDIQLFVKLIRAEIKLKEIRNNRKITVKEAANLTAGILYSSIRQMSLMPSIAHFLLGGKDNKGVYLYDLYPDGSITLKDDFVSSGSGSVFAYGVLETLYKKNMPIEDGIKLAVKAVNAALQRDSASGSGIDVVIITNKGIERVLEKQLSQKLET